jgi:hypothetical protein
MRYLILAITSAVLLGDASGSAQETAAPDEVTLATVSIPRPVLANGKPLAVGRYELRFTDDWHQPLDKGGQQGMQWLEFLSDGRVQGRELALVIPDREIDEISSWHPAAGATRVEMLKSGDFLRIWANRGGTHYLIHLAVR